MRGEGEAGGSLQNRKSKLNTRKLRNMFENNKDIVRTSKQTPSFTKFRQKHAEGGVEHEQEYDTCKRTPLLSAGGHMVGKGGLDAMIMHGPCLTVSRRN